MPNKIQIKRTSVTGRTPNTTSSGNSSFIDTGELALNITDGKLFSSNGLTYFEVGGNLQSLSVTSGLTANSTLVNAVALNVVNQTNTATLYVTTSANVASAFLVNSTGAYHTGTINAASHTVGTTTVINSTAISLGPFGVTNGASITTTSIDIGNSTANAALDYNIIYVANSSSTANLTPTTLAIGSITVNSALANLQALNVVNQTNTGTLFVTTSANVASAFLANSTGAYHTGTMNAASHTVGTTTVVNSTAIVLGPFGTTNGALITTTTFDVGNTTANAAVDYNIIYVANSTARANLTPTTLAIGSITVNSALANLQALNVVNQTNTGTLFVTTSANVASAFLANSTGAYHTGVMRTGNSTTRIILGTGMGVGEAGMYATTNTTVATIQGEFQGSSYLPVAINPNGGAVRLAGTFGTTNGVNVTNTGIVVGNSTANATLSYNLIQTSNSTSTANLTPTTLAIGSITVNSALANLQALNVVNQTNTATLYVTTSANVASAFLANSTGAYHTGTMNAASHTVGTNFTSNSSQMVLNAPSYTVSFSNTNSGATNFITWSTSLQQAIPSVTTRSLGTKIIFYDGLSGSTTDWAYGLAGSEMWASVGTTTGTFRWYAVTTAFMTSNTSFLNHTAQVRVGGGVGTTNGATITNTSISVGNSTINTTANSTTILVNGVDLVATQKRAIAMSMIFGR